MIAFLKHKVKISNNFHGFSIVEVKSSVKSIVSNISPYNRIFNEGIKKFKITNIYYQFKSKDTLKEINTLLVLNENTIIIEHKDILKSLFSGEF